MPKILYRQNRPIEINHIHVYGCSMPAGHEINDPQGIPLHLEADADYAKAKNKEQSFAAVFANLMGVEHTNNSIYGSSNGYAKSLLSMDIIKQKIKPNHAVFFCTTIIDRIHAFDPRGGKPSSIQGADLDQSLLDHYNDYKILHDHFWDLYTVLTLVKTTGAPCFFIPMFTPTTYNAMRDYNHPINPKCKAVDIRNWQEISLIKKMCLDLDPCDAGIEPFNDWIMRNEGGRGPNRVRKPKHGWRYAGGHPTVELHNIYGKMLYDLLSEKAEDA
tara:strand:+ start:168 stop:986 length:819 start_codon:yes stop_codon:yes gene_type:complete